MASATEAELRGLFENCQKATSTRTALADMGHLQPPTPVAMDNTAANSIVNGTEKQKISRAIDMRFYWVRDKTQQMFSHIMGRGKENTGRLCHKKPPDMAPYINETQICQSNKNI